MRLSEAGIQIYGDLRRMDMEKKANTEKKIYMSPYASTMREGKYLIAGCYIGNGQWLKIPSRYYDFLIECINDNMCIKDILDLCDSEYEREFYDDLLKKLFVIGVLSFEPEVDIGRPKISIDLTSRCNLRCRHCSTAYGDIPAYDMTFEDLKSIVNWCERNGVTHLTLTGGEIFLLEDIEEKLYWVKEHFSGMIDIITNGTLIRDDQLRVLKDTIDVVGISLDGYDARSTEKIRGKGVYEKVINLIKKLQDIGIEKISLSMVSTKENIDNADKFKSLCDKLKVKCMPRMLCPSGRARKYYQEFKGEEFIIDDKLDRLSFRASCMAGYNCMSSFSNGQIQPCAALDNDEYKMGNIENMLSGTLVKPDLTKWCMVDRIPGCKDCNVRYFCASSCQKMNDAIYNDEQLRADHCKSRKKKLQEAVWGC